MTETGNGDIRTVNAAVTAGAEPATIPPAGTATVDLSDLYTDVPGSLVVTKTIGGAAAGRQGAITIVPTCNGKPLAPFVIPAKTDAGSVSQEYPAIAAGADCTVTETVDGHTSTVAVVSQAERPGGDDPGCRRRRPRAITDRLHGHAGHARRQQDDRGRRGGTPGPGHDRRDVQRDGAA